MKQFFIIFALLCISTTAMANENRESVKCSHETHVTASDVAPLQGTRKCSSCNGKGQVNCSRCNGDGRVKCAGCDGRGYNTVISSSSSDNKRKCSICNGSGTTKCGSCYGKGTKNCNTCKGSGQIQVKD